jgi:hypothetical protein
MTARNGRAGWKMLDNRLLTSKGFPVPIFHSIIEPYKQATRWAFQNPNRKWQKLWVFALSWGRGWAATALSPAGAGRVRGRL